MLSVVIPWRGGDRDRTWALAWTVHRYTSRFPGCQIVYGECDPTLPFNRAAAILDGARKATSGVLLVADGDCWSDGTATAVDQVEAGEPWVVPHLKLHRLDAAATELVLSGAEPSARMGHDQPPYIGHECGTLLAIRRDVLFDVPPDVRFAAWGQEDDAWAVALRTLVGKPVRGSEPCFHLWHQPQPRLSRTMGSDANKALLQRYRRCSSRPDAMRALINEGSCQQWLSKR